MRLPADSLIKSKEFTTCTFMPTGTTTEVEFTENFGFAGGTLPELRPFRDMDITLTPVYNSIWISSDGERANLATEPAIAT